MARSAHTTKPIRKRRFTARVNSSVLPSAARIAPPISPARIDIETKPPTRVHEDSDSVIVWPWLANSTGIQPTAPPARPASALKVNSRRSTALFIGTVLYYRLERALRRCHTLPSEGINHVKPLKGFTLPTISRGRSPHPVIAGGVEPLRGSTCFLFSEKKLTNSEASSNATRRSHNRIRPQRMDEKEARAFAQTRARAPRTFRHHFRNRHQAYLRARRRQGSRFPRRYRLPRRFSLHPRRAAHDVPRAALDDAPVRRLRRRRGIQPPLPLPLRQRPDRPLGRLRPAHPDGPRRRPRTRPRRGRPRRRFDRLARRHGDAASRASARQDLHLDDDQRDRLDSARALSRRRRKAKRPVGQAQRHHPERYPQGIRRAGHVHLSAARFDAHHHRHFRVRDQRSPELEHDFDLRLPHP